MENLCALMSDLSIFDKEMSNELVLDEREPVEVRNVCDLMNAIFSESAVYEAGRLCKEKCRGCEVSHPSQRRHECLMLSENEVWSVYGLEAVERVFEKGIVSKQFFEAIRVLKLEYYSRAKVHYNSLGKNYEETYDFLTSLRLRSNFKEFQAILNYLLYWSKDK